VLSEGGIDYRTEVPLPAAVTRWIGITAKPGKFDDRTNDQRDRQRVMAHCFLQVAELGGLERIGRYEASLWRQFVQVLFALDETKRHQLGASRRRFTPYPPQW
jgi:hypothetical protein